MNASVPAPGSSGARRASSDQELPARLLQLGDVTPGIAAQVRAQRGRRPDAAEQRGHRAVPQQAHVIDRIRPGGHPGDQARHLQVRVDPALAARPDVLRDQVRQPGALRQGHHRHQPGVRHEIRVIERCARLREAMQQSHLPGALSSSATEASATPIVPAQRAPFTLTRPETPLIDRWIEAKYRALAAIQVNLEGICQTDRHILLSTCGDSPGARPGLTAPPMIRSTALTPAPPMCGWTGTGIHSSTSSRGPW